MPRIQVALEHMRANLRDFGLTSRVSFRKAQDGRNPRTEALGGSALTGPSMSLRRRKTGTGAATSPSRRSSTGAGSRETSKREGKARLAFALVSDPSGRLYPAPMPLEFGVFQGASVGPRPWDVTEPLRIRRDIEVGIAADAAGFDTYWAPSTTASRSTRTGRRRTSPAWRSACRRNASA